MKISKNIPKQQNQRGFFFLCRAHSVAALCLCTLARMARFGSAYLPVPLIKILKCYTNVLLKKLNIFLKIVFLNNLYTQHGAWIYNPKIKSSLLYWLNQPGTLTFNFNHIMLHCALCFCSCSSNHPGVPSPLYSTWQMTSHTSRDIRAKDILFNLAYLATCVWNRESKWTPTLSYTKIKS